MTMYLDLSTDEKLETFIKKYNEILEKEDENFDLTKIITELNQKGEKK